MIRHGPVRSLAEAAEARGVEPADVVKTLVVRRGEGDFLFVLVPGDRAISWPKLRDLLGVSRMSMPDAATALEATGYERGTITPFGSTTAWPVIADERLRRPRDHPRWRRARRRRGRDADAALLPSTRRSPTSPTRGLTPLPGTVRRPPNSPAGSVRSVTTTRADAATTIPPGPPSARPRSPSPPPA